jgi:lysophospholipase
MIESAPFFADVAGSAARAVWVKSTDGLRLRLAVWDNKGAKGTIFLLPGRTEYVEKYGLAAAEMVARGFDVMAIDWRGQGLSEGRLPDPMVGHVDDFAEYQCDLDAMLDAAQAMGLPEPYFMMAHSMGGCIGLRTLMGTHPFKAAAFSAPMWGIALSTWMRPLASIIATASGWFGLSHIYAPGTGSTSYVNEAAFLGNVLTTDAEMWAYMGKQTATHAELALGGPSMAWAKAAMTECHALSMMQSPDLPCYVALGTAEKVVDPMPIHARMSVWRQGQLDLYTGLEHEIMMEIPSARTKFYDKAAGLFTV